MNNMEFNKIFAAILVAGIIASLAGFISRELIHPHELAEDAIFVEGAISVAGIDAGPQLPEPILAMIATADIARGERLSRACAACHTFHEGGADTGAGPNLWNVVNQTIANNPGFAYSNAMAELGGVWDYNALNHFLWRPRAYVPGTKMNFIGLRNPEDRVAMIAWLRSLSGAPAPLPTAAEISAEEAELAPPPAEEAAEEPAVGETDQPDNTAQPE